jgi:hypothetical protein
MQKQRAPLFRRGSLEDYSASTYFFGAEESPAAALLFFALWL